MATGTSRAGKLVRAGLRVALCLVVLGALFVVAGALRIAAWRPPRAGMTPLAEGRIRARVGIHVHTSVAGGRGTLDEVAREAHVAGLDAVFITDHASFALAPRAGYHDGVLVLVGSELNTDSGHLLALGLDEPASPPGFEADAAVEDVHAAGGLAVAAHPSRPGRRELFWTGTVGALDGVEVANLDSGWRLAPYHRIAWAALAFPLAPARALAASAVRDRRALNMYDAFLDHRQGLALGGPDAHGSIAGYRAALGALVDECLLERPLIGEASFDRALVLDALRRRHVLVAYAAIADPRAASFTASRGGEHWVAGDVAPAGGPLELRLATGLDRDAALVIYSYGRVIASGRGRELRATVSEQGGYRGEVTLDGPFAVPWLYTNAIGLAGPLWPMAPMTDADLADLTAPPGPGPAAIDLLAGLKPEFDATSSVEVINSAPLVARFRLGQPRPPARDSWCALVDRTPRDLRAYRAVVVEGSADRPVRVDLAFTTAAGKRLARSIRLEPERRVHRLLLWWFRERVAGHGNDAPELPAAPVTNFLVTVDVGNARPGAAGELRLDALRLD